MHLPLSTLPNIGLSGMEGYRVAVLVLSGPENFAKREKLRRNFVVPGTVAITLCNSDAKAVQKFS